jgi:DNA-binding NarL/FixJ family response regulator
MHKNPLHILILESSRIIFEGLYTILHQSDLDCKIYKIDAIDELNGIIETEKIDILISNLLHFVNREKEIRKFRKDNPDISIVGIDYGMMQKTDPEPDALFSLYDSQEKIISLLSRLDSKNKSITKENEKDDNLTKREIEVLSGIVNGMINKEIADSLNISIHTVVRHRKNITTKTGIRSQSGLTIYAISKNIVNIEDLKI